MLEGLGLKLYKRAPLFLQHAMFSAYGWYWKRQRLHGVFPREIAGFLARERFTAPQWDAYSNQQLQQLLVSAYRRVPHYQHIWSDLGITAADLSQFTTQDLVKLPPLEKRTARDAPYSLLIDGHPHPHHQIYHTSGSTGTPIATYWMPDEHQRSVALKEARSHRFAGVSLKNPRGTFGGRLIEPDPYSDGPFYRYNLFEKQVYFSAFHLAPQNAQKYVDALWQHKVEWLTGYGNSIYQLGRMILDQRLKAPSLKAVVTTSEKIMPAMREVIEEAFSTRLYEEYGALENVFFATECEYGRMHISPDAGVIEIVDENFQPVPVGTPGEVLATGFIRPSQPMIRYRIGDIAAFSDEVCPCGRAMPVLKEVLGRLEDTVYGPDGRRMVRFHGIFIDQPHVEEGQIIQEALNQLRVLVVPKPGFDDSDEREIIHRIHERVTPQMRVEVEKVAHIQRTPAGKLRAVISLLSPEEIEQAQQL